MLHMIHCRSHSLDRSRSSRDLRNRDVRRGRICSRSSPRPFMAPITRYNFWPCHVISTFLIRRNTCTGPAVLSISVRVTKQVQELGPLVNRRPIALLCCLVVSPYHPLAFDISSTHLYVTHHPSLLHRGHLAYNSRVVAHQAQWTQE